MRKRDGSPSPVWERVRGEGRPSPREARPTVSRAEQGSAFHPAPSYPHPCPLYVGCEVEWCVVRDLRLTCQRQAECRWRGRLPLSCIAAPVVSGGAFGQALRSGPEGFCSEPAGSRQSRQSGGGGGDAQADRSRQPRPSQTAALEPKPSTLTWLLSHTGEGDRSRFRTLWIILRDADFVCSSESGS